MNKIFVAASSALLATGFFPVASAQQDLEIEEIVVTASKREGSVQDFAGAVTAFSGAVLDERGIVGLDDLRLAAPNLYIEEGLGQNTTASIYMRGHGQINPSFFFDAPVAIYSNGVIYARPVGALVDLPDVERIEVLRGPQGTLFGRNASAGAIHIISKDAPLNTSDFFGEIGAGNESQINARFGIGVPLIEDVSGFRFSGVYRENDGYQSGLNSLTGQVEDGFYQDDLLTLSASYRHLLGDATELTIRGEYLSDTGLGPGGKSLLPGPGAPGLPENDPNDLFTFITNQDKSWWDVRDVSTWLLSATVEHSFRNGVDLTSITAYREQEQFQRADGDGLGLPGVFEQTDAGLDEQFSQEIYFSGGEIGSAPVSWVAGFYYFNETYDSDGDLVIFPGVGGRSNYDQETTSWAVYGSATWSVTDRFELTAGLRYTDDEKDFTGFWPDEQPVPGTFTGTFAEDKTNYDISAAYDFTDNVRVYARAATSFRLGGFPATFDSTSIAPFASEESTNYEVGVKSTLFDSRATLNATYFMMEYENMQVPVILPDGTITQELADTDVSGLEVEFNFLVSDTLSFFGNLATLDNEVNAQGGLLAQAPGLSRAPEFSGQIGMDLNFDMNSGAAFNFGVDYAYTDDYQTGVQDQTGVDAFGTLNARATFTLPNKRWQISATGWNMTDEIYSLHTFVIIPGLIETITPNQGARWLLAVRYTMN